MGQKVNVNSLHLVNNKSWTSFWYSDYNNYLPVFQEDFFIYAYIRSKSELKYNVLKRKHTYKIEIIKAFIYRTKKSIILNLHLVYLKKHNLTNKDLQYFIKTFLLRLKKLFNYKKNGFLISYKIGQNTAIFLAIKIAALIEKRIKLQSKTLKTLIKQIKLVGITVSCKGRLNFKDRANKKQISIGSVPLQTIDINIDYGFVVANTQKGLQSIKVWVFNKK